MSTIHPGSGAAVRPMRGTLAAAIAAFALAGCANYMGIHSDKRIAPESQFDSTQSLPAEGGHWPALDWASQFGDPQLPKLIDEALEDNPSIAQAQARLAKASAYIQSSRATLFPKVEGSYSWTRELYSGNGLFPPPYGGSWFSENNALLSASWELDLWGKNREKLKSAVSQQKAAQAEFQQARITLATSIARTYNQLAQLYALRDIAQREIGNRETVGKITEGRVGAGLDTNVERQTARGNVATSQSSLSELDGQITTVRYQLAALLGKGPDRGLQIAMPVLKPGGAIDLPGNIPADLVSRRPDIVAARWQVEARIADVKETKAEFFPDVNLAAGVGFDAFGWGQFLKFASRQAQFGPAVHLPIFYGGALRAQLRGSYADYDLSVANYNQTLIGALNDVATQVATIRAVDKQMGDAQRALDASTRAYELAVIRYKAGLSPQLQVLSADINRLSAEQTVTNLVMRRRDMQIGLIKSLGGGFDATGTPLAAAPEKPAGAAARDATTAHAPPPAATATQQQAAN
ncbi:efflux transporter outer membrane subunit [Burkholderia gladioli]|uniref:efflux transporter outer membrane subunit n=1 Tax=Burkholderia gladioli TaxID=28095 RepID=UPI001907738B|nr:efflux transporter outer membrane subunit [Burkholderia gladioli]MBJ9710717.1 efflux transporter outer membrane subunit [Burkholderia gladioli]